MGFRYVIEGFSAPGQTGAQYFLTEDEIDRRYWRGIFGVNDAGVLDEHGMSLGPFYSYVDDHTGVMISERVFAKPPRVEEDQRVIGPLLLIDRLLRTLPGVPGLITPEKARLKELHDELERSSLAFAESGQTGDLHDIYRALATYAEELASRFKRDNNVSALNAWAQRKLQEIAPR